MSDATRFVLIVACGLTTLTCFVMFCALRPHINSTITKLLACLLFVEMIGGAKSTILLNLIDDPWYCTIQGALAHITILFHVVLNACLAFESYRLASQQRELESTHRRERAPTLSTTTDFFVAKKKKTPCITEQRIVFYYLSLAVFISGASTVLALFVSPGFGSNDPKGEKRHYCHMASPSNEVDIPLFFMWIWIAMVVCLCCNVAIARILYSLAPGEAGVLRRLRASIVRLILYPMIFAVSWGPVMMLHIYTRAVPYHPPYAVALIFELLATMTGLFDAIALGLSHRKIREQLRAVFLCEKYRKPIISVDPPCNHLLLSGVDEDPFSDDVQIKFYGEISETRAALLN